MRVADAAHPDKMYETSKTDKALAIGGISIIVFVATVILGYGEQQQPDDYWYVSIIRDGYTIEKIPVYYVDEPFLCEDHVGLARGCFVHGATGKYIKLVESMEFDWANQGCTVHDHEFFHAMGYGHGTGPLATTCPNSAWEWPDFNNGKPYDPNNIKHWDPLYKHIPRELNPKMIKWK